MRNFYKLFKFLIALACLGAFAGNKSFAAGENKILQADSIHIIKEALKGASEKTLVVFDCDDVLTAAKGAVLKKGSRRFIKEWYSSSDKSLSFLDLVYKILALSESSVVNAEMPQLVRSLHEKNSKALVVTGFSTKPFQFGNVRDPKLWRTQRLNSLGYNFEKFWPGVGDKYFDGFGDPYDPSFSKGIVYTGVMLKSKGLEAFLNCVHFNPTAIIFIDDSEKILTEVSEWAKSKGIDFVGIHYTEASKIVPDFPFSKERAQLQLDTVMGEDRWLSDGEAEDLLNQQE
ncbi:MAG: DUF2608 domain-containing protein [Puniceicoccales bacterium]|jgi:hypothetical protein|nr:DUF2608 domain-containing protein [Puniceicoccales bacterium]